MATRRLKDLDVNVDSIRNSFWDKKSRRSGAEKWNKSDLLGESGAIDRSDAGRGRGRDSCGGGERVEGMSVATVDGGRSIATCDGVWMRTGVADHCMGLGEMRRRGEAASAGCAWVLVLMIIRKACTSESVGLRKDEEGGGRTRKNGESRFRYP